MREVTVEFDNFDAPTNNEIRHMNRHVYKKLLTNLKTRILVAVGEGPWPKINFGPEYSAAVRKDVIIELHRRWPEKMKCFAEYIQRRPRRYDNDNLQGGMKPIWDAFVRMGWMVDDHPKWFDHRMCPQVLGDPKMIVTIWIPQTKKDLEQLETRFKPIQSALEARL